MDKFANQTEDFVANWLKESGLEKLVDIFKGTTIKVFDICVEIFIYQFHIHGNDGIATACMACSITEEPNIFKLL